MISYGRRPLRPGCLGLCGTAVFEGDEDLFFLPALRGSVNHKGDMMLVDSLDTVEK